MKGKALTKKSALKEGWSLVTVFLYIYIHIFFIRFHPLGTKWVDVEEEEKFFKRNKTKHTGRVYSRNFVVKYFFLQEHLKLRTPFFQDSASLYDAQ